MAIIPVQIKAWMEVLYFGQSVLIPVSSFSLTYALNAIPSGTVTVPTGISVYDSVTLSPIHTPVGRALLSTSRMVPVRIYILPEGLWNFRTFWGAQPIRIFDGYIVNSSEQSSSGRSTVSFQLVNWLINLDLTPAISAVSHPKNAADYTWRAAAPKIDATTTGTLPGPEKVSLSKMVGIDLINEANATADLWGQGIQLWINKLAEQAASESYSPLTCLTVQQTQTFNRALTALSRLEGDGNVGAGRSAWYRPLSFTGYEGDRVLAEAIATDLGEEALDSSVTTSLWGKMIQYAGRYAFAFVPRVNTAMAAPYIPCVRGVYKTLWMDDTFQQGKSYARMHPIRASVMVSPYDTSSSTGSVVAGLSPDLVTFGAGCYAPPEMANSPDGTLLFNNVPPWMASYVYGANSPESSFLGAGGSGAPTSSSSANQGDGKGDNMTRAATRSRGILDRLAAYAYNLEVLRGSTATITSKFRLDIAPGSSVRVQKPAEKRLGGWDLSANDYVGSVQRMTLVLDAEAQIAQTDFQLNAVRTIDQHNSDIYTVAEHPLYSPNTFVGAPLVDGLEFFNE